MSGNKFIRMILWMFMTAGFSVQLYAAPPTPALPRSAPAPVTAPASVRGTPGPVAGPAADALPQTNLTEEDVGEEPATGPRKPGMAKQEKKRSFDNSRTDIVIYNKTVSDKGRVKSLFFTQTEVNDVHLAVNTYLKNIGRGGDLTFDEEAFLSRLSVVKNTVPSTNTQSHFFTYPQFFLDSLVYYSATNWLIWINGEKITQDTPKESSNIHVTEISADRVTLEWFPLEMDRVMEIWRRSPNNDVTVNTKHGQVIFSLKPNQTFSSYLMKSVEGRILPMTVDVTKLPVNFPEDIHGAETSSEKKPVEEEKKEGLTGLINSYKEIQKDK